MSLIRLSQAAIVLSVLTLESVLLFIYFIALFLLTDSKTFNFQEYEMCNLQYGTKFLLRHARRDFSAKLEFYVFRYI